LRRGVREKLRLRLGVRLRFGLYIVGLLTRLNIWGYVLRKGMGIGWRIEDGVWEVER